jgi:hypothetical protein
VRITVYDTPALIVDPAAVRAWLAQPSDEYPDLSRAESLGVDDELTAPSVGGFLDTIDDVLAAEPDGLHRRADIARVEMWVLPDGEVLGQGALITVDLTDGVRVASMHQDIKDFVHRDQHGTPAVLAALTHIANQVSLLLDSYHAANPRHRVGTATTTVTGTTHEAGPDPEQPAQHAERVASTAGRVTVAELIERLHGFPPQLPVWVADPRSIDGYAPLNGTVHPGSDPAPTGSDPAQFVVLGTAR